MHSTFTLSILSILFIASLVESNDIRLGYVQGNSKKIYSAIKEANPALWTRTDDVIINASGNDLISAIFVTDLRDYKDGDAYIESGGIGQKSVTIGLKSPSILRGYKFEIEVYADNPMAGYFSKGITGINGRYYDDVQYPRKY